MGMIRQSIQVIRSADTTQTVSIHVPSLGNCGLITNIAITSDDTQTANVNLLLRNASSKHNVLGVSAAFSGVIRGFAVYLYINSEDRIELTITDGTQGKTYQIDIAGIDIE